MESLSRRHIVVLTAGPWFSDLGDMEWGLNYINETLTRWRAEQKTLPRMIWKTQNPGHANCDEFAGPISWYEERLMNLSYVQSEYNWNLFPIFDRMAKEFFADMDVEILDMAPLFLRPDAHPGKVGKVHKLGANQSVKDCLHYCVPGPLDLFATLLYHALLEPSRKRQHHHKLR